MLLHLPEGGWSVSALEAKMKAAGLKWSDDGDGTRNANFVTCTRCGVVERTERRVKNAGKAVLEHCPPPDITAALEQSVCLKKEVGVLGMMISPGMPLSADGMSVLAKDAEITLPDGSTVVRLDKPVFVPLTEAVHPRMAPGPVPQFSISGTTPSERKRPALHYLAPPGQVCMDCRSTEEACPPCYAAWWSERHPGYRFL